MKYSVVIPAYHAQDTIIECIDSIVSDAEDAEILVVSDAREESEFIETQGIIEAYIQEKQPSVSIIYLRNEREQGVSGARNTGLNHAKGEYVWFVDSDDLASLTWKDSWDQASQKQTDLVIAGYENWIEQEKKECKKCIGKTEVFAKHEFVLRYLQTLKENWFIHAVWNKIFRREFLIENGVVFPEHGSMGEDLCFCLKAIQKASFICLSEDIVYRYMQRENHDNACTKFHEDALDMTCLAWQTERDIYEQERIKFPESEKNDYQESATAYQNDLMLAVKGTWKKLYTSEQKIVNAGIQEKRTLFRLGLRYCKYRIMRMRLKMKRIRNKDWNRK